MDKFAKALPLAFLLFGVLTGRPASALTPGEQLQGAVQQVLSVVKDPVSSEAQRKKLLRQTLMPVFDWGEMAKQALGKNWALAAGRENEFIAAFAEFLGNSYAGTIGSYKDEKIVFIRESIDKDRAQVNTQIIPSKGDPTSVNYRLHLVQGEWKVYDVVIEDISLVVNFRSQFSRILAKGSFEDLLRQLREREFRSQD
ncbi:MAG TPA: ABC transporter substrate-binding protein [Candidatus Binatia bacterium]|nr:ABC transporter substrate-binding protein [Candidatus Binatia bacterium]